jgi:hypothetical protein
MGAGLYQYDHEVATCGVILPVNPVLRTGPAMLGALAPA